MVRLLQSSVWDYATSAALWMWRNSTAADGCGTRLPKIRESGFCPSRDRMGRLLAVFVNFAIFVPPPWRVSVLPQ
jgi:hypothetical protein